MIVTVVAVTDGEEWTVLASGSKVEDLDPACVHSWTFENKKRTTLSMMRTEAIVGDLGLVRDQLNRYSPDEYAIGKAIGYMTTHCETWTHKTAGAETGTVVTEPTIKQVSEDIPFEVLIAYFGRSFVGVNKSAVKKQKPAGAPETGEAPTNSD